MATATSGTHFRQYLSKYQKGSPKALDEMLAEMICFDTQPFSIVLDRGFRKFIQTLDPRYEIPGRKKITHVIIPRLYKREEEAVKKELENTEHIALTTDEWTSRTTEGYISCHCPLDRQQHDIAVKSSRDKENNTICDIGEYKR
ncbi:zinc finger BED domain-containing protein 1 [Elysia marginata]|uniref:Zinc finger BED domain-containing protein 1 n=1 Tax=Elysia marginata TaxID=1093978 RepID=A0AAV4JVI6_9GAST|nr:zinc finger BED domain-containing protein 1 [Elysia marginata]